MCNNQLDRVMRLVRRTGDRCVILDNESEEAVVVMSLDEYERILDCDDNMCSCCEDDEDFLNMESEENDEIFSKDDAIQFKPEEEQNVETVVEEKVVDLPIEEPQNFANIGQEDSLKDVPAEEADRFYLEQVDE